MDQQKEEQRHATAQGDSTGGDSQELRFANNLVWQVQDMKRQVESGNKDAWYRELEFGGKSVLGNLRGSRRVRKID